MKRTLLIILTAVASVWFVSALLNPINDFIQRASVLGALGCLWLGLVGLCWRFRKARAGLLVLPLIAMIPFLFPGRGFDREALREDYVRRVKAFEGTRYVWGGEGGGGIDCSGLPRRALRDAMWSRGIRNLDGGLLRSAAEQWWFDSSAKALREGYRDFARPLNRQGKLREMDFAGLLPGDLAITLNGVHVLVYAGAGRWIQADPGAGKVVNDDPKVSESGWYDSPVSLHRWSVFTVR